MKRRKRETKRQRKAREATYVRVVQHGQSNAASPAELGFAHWWHVTEPGQTITRERYSEAVLAIADSIGGVDLVADAGHEPTLQRPAVDGADRAEH